MTLEVGRESERLVSDVNVSSGQHVNNVRVSTTEITYVSNVSLIKPQVITNLLNVDNVPMSAETQ
jgi:hypothetical protein